MMVGMVDAARSTTSLLGKLRSSFGTSGVLASPTILASPTALATPAQDAALAQEVPPSSTPQIAQTSPTGISTAEKLEVLDKVLGEVEQEAVQAQLVQSVQPNPTPQITAPELGVVAQATSAAVDQAVHQQHTQQAQVPTHAKEVLVSASAPVETVAQAPVETPDQAALSQEPSAPESVANAPVIEAATGVQYIEQEPAPEIPPEVAEYLEHVENHANQQPQEIVIAPDQQNIPLATTYPKQSVVVLPITPGVEQEGIKKGPLWSIRWLVEWSRKLMKMFSGQIIYREVESKN